MLRNNAFLLFEQLLNYIKYTFVFDTSALSFINGQLISKCLFGVFNSSKKRTKNFCPSRLGQRVLSD